MKKTLLFDFTVDKPNKTVIITREFNAPIAHVWDAFTKKEILDQWTGPAPFRARTKFMDFKVGGRRFYAMVGPDGQQRWSVQQYTSISPKTNFKYISSFADENENVDTQWPGSEWDLTFSEQNGITTVRIVIKNESLQRMETMLEMGFREGFMATIKNLEELLSRL